MSLICFKLIIPHKRVFGHQSHTSRSNGGQYHYSIARFPRHRQNSCHNCAILWAFGFQAHIFTTFSRIILTFSVLHRPESELLHQYCASHTKSDSRNDLPVICYALVLQHVWILFSSPQGKWSAHHWELVAQAADGMLAPHGTLSEKRQSFTALQDLSIYLFSCVVLIVPTQLFSSRMFVNAPRVITVSLI